MPNPNLHSYGSINRSTVFSRIKKRFWQGKSYFDILCFRLLIIRLHGFLIIRVRADVASKVKVIKVHAQPVW